ncbi:MAG: hypothetical protein ACJ757_13695 [Gaiellaceae bacterium]
MRERFGLRQSAGLATIAAAAAVTSLVLAIGASASGNAGYTTFIDASTCVHGSVINCNTYVAKTDVWTNGGPTTGSGLTDGDYFFAVLVPGFQNEGFIDGAAGNLSDATQSPDKKSDLTYAGAGTGDTVDNRTFTVSGGKITAYGGTHGSCDSATGALLSPCPTATDQGLLIQLAPFDDTTNGGGVYILAICTVGATSDSECKFDAFKLQNGAPCTTDCNADVAADLTVTKDGAGTYDTKWTWGISKNVDKTSVTLTGGGTATFNYTVGVTHDSGADSNVTLTGGIDVVNPNPTDDVTGVDVADTLSDTTVCTVAGGTNDGSNETIPASGSTQFTYSCDVSAYAHPPLSLFNTATVTWPTQFLATDGTLVGNDASYTFPTDPLGDGIAFTQTKINDCVNVTDSQYTGGSPTGTLGQVCQSDASPTSFQYSKTVNAPTAGTCSTYNNTATFTATDDATVSGTANQSVQVCDYNGALTPGYWKNHLVLDRKNPLNPYVSEYLPQSIGVYAVNTTTKSTAVFNAMNCANSNYAISCLAGHLLAAEYNIANKSNPCISGVITSANAFLTNPTATSVTYGGYTATSMNYTGPQPSYSGLTSAQRSLALALKNALDKYNNGGGC